MLHLTLAANLLNAVGGTPDLTEPGFVPELPGLPAGRRDRLRGRAGGASPGRRWRPSCSIERPARGPGRGRSRTRRPRYPQPQPPRGRPRRHPRDALLQHRRVLPRDLARAAPPARRAGRRAVLRRSRRGRSRPSTSTPGRRDHRGHRPRLGQGGDRADRRAGRGRSAATSTTTSTSSPTTTASSSSPSGATTSTGDDPAQPTAVRICTSTGTPSIRVKTDARLADFPPDRVTRPPSSSTADYGRIPRARSPRPTTAPGAAAPTAVGEMFRLRDRFGPSDAQPDPGRRAVNAAPTFEIDAAMEALN